MYRADVTTGDPNWASNALRFKTPDEAKAYAVDLAGRWMSVKRIRVVDDTTPAREPVNPKDPRIVVDYS